MSTANHDYRPRSIFAAVQCLSNHLIFNFRSILKCNCISPDLASTDTPSDSNKVESSFKIIFRVLVYSTRNIQQLYARTCHDLINVNGPSCDATDICRY